MGTKFDYTEQILPTLADFSEIAVRSPNRESGIIRWTEDHVFFCYDLPEWDAHPEILNSSIQERAKEEFPDYEPHEVYVLIGVDLETGRIVYEFFIDGLDDVEFSRRDLDEILRVHN